MLAYEAIGRAGATGALVVQLITRERKSAVLRPSTVPCLRGLSTINMTEGCALGCIYCYTRGYAGNPGDERVTLFADTPQRLAAELRRRRRWPGRVYFSSASDAFQPLPQVQDATLRTMRILLEAGIGVAFLTKGFVSDEFLPLFRAWPGRVFAQIGVTTLDPRLWAAFEPRTAPPAQRLETMPALIASGVPTTARLDPLIPDVTDTDDNLAPLLTALHAAGVRAVAASYLFLRPAFAARVQAEMRRLRSRTAAARWEYLRFEGGFAGGKTIAADERERRFARLGALAASVGVQLRVCRCKNPDLAASGCEVGGQGATPAPGSTRQQMFGFARERPVSLLPTAGAASRRSGAAAGL